MAVVEHCAGACSEYDGSVMSCQIVNREAFVGNGWASHS